MTVWQGILAEAFLAFMLMTAIMAVAVDHRAQRLIRPHHRSAVRAAYAPRDDPGGRIGGRARSAARRQCAMSVDSALAIVR